MKAKRSAITVKGESGGGKGKKKAKSVSGGARPHREKERTAAPGRIEDRRPVSEETLARRMEKQTLRRPPSMRWIRRTQGIRGRGA